MRILDFLRRNRESKNNIQTNPTDELSADVVNNETEEDRIRRELLSRTYDEDYLFYANHDQTIEINGKSVTYSRLECYLSSTEWPSHTTQLIRLTGDNLTGTPIPIKYRKFVNSGIGDGTITRFVDFGQLCMLYPNSIGHTCYPKNGPQYLTGFQIAEKVKEYNDHNLEVKLRKLDSQQSEEELWYRG